MDDEIKRLKANAAVYRSQTKKAMAEVEKLTKELIAQRQTEALLYEERKDLNDRVAFLERKLKEMGRSALRSQYETTDCNLCSWFKRSKCTSVIQCELASQYKSIPIIQLWK